MLAFQELEQDGIDLERALAFLRLRRGEMTAKLLRVFDARLDFYGRCRDLDARPFQG